MLAILAVGSFELQTSNLPRPRVVHSDFHMGGDLSPPIGGGPMGGDKGPMGGGLARDSRQIREVKKLGFKMF